MVMLLWFGGIALVLGGAIAGYGWTNTTECYPSFMLEPGDPDYCPPSGELKSDGSGVLVAGLLLAGVGQILFLVGIIGYGVKLGVRAAKGE